MLPGPPLKAEPLVVIIKDGGSVDLQEALGWQRVGVIWHRRIGTEGLDWIVTLSSSTGGGGNFTFCVYVTQLEMGFTPAR